MNAEVIECRQKGRSGYELVFLKSQEPRGIFSVIQTTVLFACAVLVYLYNYVLICMYVISVRHIVSTFVCVYYVTLFIMSCLLTCMWIPCRILLLCYSICFIVHSMFLLLISTLHSYFFPNRAKHTIMKTRKKNNLKYPVKASTNALVLPFYWSRLALSPFFCILTHVSFSAIVLLYSLPYIHLLHLQ